MNAHRKEASRHNTRSLCQHDGFVIFASCTRAEDAPEFQSRDREGPSLSAVDKNYPSSSADECELLPLLGGRQIVAAK